MKTPRFFELLPPAPATRLEIEAFHLRERRLFAGLATGAALLCVGLVLVLASLARQPMAQAALWGIATFCQSCALLFAWDTYQAHAALGRKRKGAGRDT